MKLFNFGRKTAEQPAIEQAAVAVAAVREQRIDAEAALRELREVTAGLQVTIERMLDESKRMKSGKRNAK